MEMQEQLQRAKQEVERLLKQLDNKERLLQHYIKRTKNAEEMEAMQKSKVTKLQQQKKLLQKQLDYQRNKTSSIDIDFNGEHLSKQRQEKIKQLEERNHQMMSQIQDLRSVQKKQKVQMQQFQIKLQELQSQKQEPSFIPNVKDQSDYSDLPNLIPQHSNKQERKEQNIQTDFTQPSIFIKNHQEYPKINEKEEKAKPKAVIRSVKKQKIKEKELEDEDAFLMKEDLNDQDFEIPLNITSSNKRIMQSIFKHYEKMSYDKKWSFLNMLCCWSEGKMDTICKTIKDMQD